MEKLVDILCVARRSNYKHIPYVDCWDIKRDVRNYSGTNPIVAHPPCRSWSAHCAHQAKPYPGEKELGPLCVDFLFQNGGVLEHPAHSRLYDYCGLPKPGNGLKDQVYTLEVWQSWFGYPMKKSTWVTFFGVDHNQIEIPFTLRNREDDRRRQQLMSNQQRSETTYEFAMWLIQYARISNTAALAPAVSQSG